MKEAILPNGLKIEYFDSVEELPIIRSHKFNEYLALDSGIGSNMDDVDTHIGSLMRMIAKGDKEKATQELLNMRQNIQNVLENMDYSHMAFACMVHKVDGKEWKDLTENGLKTLLRMLSAHGLSLGVVRFIIEEIKKKLRPRLRSISRTSPIKTER